MLAEVYIMCFQIKLFFLFFFLQTLKNQLETAKDQFLEIDDYKRFNKDLKMKYMKLIDEYKKVKKTKIFWLFMPI